MFALVIATLVFNVILIVRIRYGDNRITHLTLKPYWAAMLFLISVLTETTIVLIMQAADPKLWNMYTTGVHPDKLSQNFIDTLAYLSIYVKYFFLLSFIMTRAFEYRILNYFVLFQNNLRV